jgi:hypothetical protein
MRHYGNPGKRPIDQDDLIARIREMERLDAMITPQLGIEKKRPDFAMMVMRYSLVGVEVKRLLMYAEEVLTDDDLDVLKDRLNSEIEPEAINRFEKYRSTDYETAEGL